MIRHPGHERGQPVIHLMHKSSITHSGRVALTLNGATSFQLPFCDSGGFKQNNLISRWNGRWRPHDTFQGWQWRRRKRQIERRRWKRRGSVLKHLTKQSKILQDTKEMNVISVIQLRYQANIKQISSKYQATTSQGITKFSSKMTTNTRTRIPSTDFKHHTKYSTKYQALLPISRRSDAQEYRSVGMCLA
jgi:hypothetical protein